MVFLVFLVWGVAGQPGQGPVEVSVSPGGPAEVTERGWEGSENPSEAFLPAGNKGFGGCGSSGQDLCHTGGDRSTR